MINQITFLKGLGRANQGKEREDEDGDDGQAEGLGQHVSEAVRHVNRPVSVCAGPGHWIVLCEYQKVNPILSSLLFLYQNVLFLIYFPFYVLHHKKLCLKERYRFH